MHRVTFSLVLVTLVTVVGRGETLAQSRFRDRDNSSSFRNNSPSFRDNSRNPVTPHGISSAFGARAHVSQLASELYRQSNAACWEMHRYYQRNPGFDRAYRDMYAIKEGAKRIDALVRQGGNRQVSSDNRVERELQELDRFFHEFETDIGRWRPDSRYTPKTQLDVLLTQCEESLHHLMDDYGVRSAVHRDDGRNDGPGRGPGRGSNRGPDRGPSPGHFPFEN